MLLAEETPTEKPLKLESTSMLLRALLALAAPVLVEQLLHAFAGLADTYIGNNVVRISAEMSAEAAAAAQAQNTAAGAAVGTIAYLLWFVGLISGAVGTGATAIIARATGARHKRLANSICGQAVGLAAIVGLVLGLLVYLFAEPIARVTHLPPQAIEYAHVFLKTIAFGLPFMVILFVANAALRGAGDTISPAVAMIVVDVVNISIAFSLTFGWFGLPALGFRGIAIGAVCGYAAGGTLQVINLLRGRGGLRLHLHRLRPHWHNMRRLLRIGIPSGMESGIMWGVNFVLIWIINDLDKTAAFGAAHAVAVRIEAFSYLGGFALAIAASTLVGQSLGMNDPRRAERCAYLAFAVAGGLMFVGGACFVLFGDVFARMMSNDPVVIDLTTKCLFATGFIQPGFAAGIVFGGALRGAGDTMSVMKINFLSLVCGRLVGVLILTKFFNVGLVGIWILLSAELFVRGMAMFLRFRGGRWKKVRV